MRNRQTAGAAEGPAGPEVSVLLATLNERGSLPLILEQIHDAFSTSPEIIVVDDGSKDGTAEFLQSWTLQNPLNHAILNSTSRTLINAQFQGLGLARGKYVIIMDSDLQHPVSLIPTLCKELRDGCDLVVGSRYMAGGSTGGRQALRGLVSRAADGLTRFLLPMTRALTDPMSGYFGFRAAAFEQLQVPHRGYKFLLYLISRNRTARVREVPYRFGTRRAGESKVVKGPSVLLLFIVELLSDFRACHRNQARVHASYSQLSFPAPGRGETGSFQH